MSFGGGGGGGGTSAQTKAERDAAIRKVNQYFGIETPGAPPVAAAPPTAPTASPIGGQPWGVSAPARPAPFAPAVGAVPNWIRTNPAPVATGPDLIAEQNKAAREAMYGKTRQDVIDLGTRDLTDQTTKAQRGLRFALGRKGQIGGSVDVDLNRELSDDASRASTKVYQSGLAAENQFRTADEVARQNAINVILGGADAGTALQGATAQLSQNARDIAGRDYGGAAGEAFSSLGDIIGARARTTAAATAADKFRAAGLAQPRGTYGQVTS